MKIINKSTDSAHLLLHNQHFNKVSILISPLTKFLAEDRRVAALRFGQRNTLQVARSYRQAGYSDIQLVVDSKSFPEHTALTMQENYKGDKFPVYDASTGMRYTQLSTFDYLWQAYKLHPNEELASLISKYLIQKIPLQFQHPKECVSHHLDVNSSGYTKLMIRVAELQKSHEDQLTSVTSVSEFDEIIEVDTFAQVSYHLESEQCDTYVLWGLTGTGKTKFGLQPIARQAHDGKKVVYLSYLIALVKQFCEMTNSVSYKNAKLHEIEGAHSLGVVVNSSYKDHIASFLLNCDVLIIDEFEKVVSVVCGCDEEVMPRKALFKILKKALRLIPKVIVADADISDTTLAWLKKMRKRIRVIKATQNPYRHITATIGDKYNLFSRRPEQMEKERVILFDTVKAMRLTMVDYGFTNSSGQACEKVALKSKVLVIHAKNKGLPEQSAFMENPSEEVLKYKLVMASPCIASGFSIESEYTDNVNLVSNLTLGVFELINFARRFRSSENITFYLTQLPLYDYTPLECTSSDSECDKLAIEFENKKKLFNSNQPLSMQWALTKLGFKVNVLKTSPKLLDVGRQKFYKLNAMDVESLIVAILNARLTTQAEIESLTMLNQLGFEEQAMIKKHEIMRDYQLDEIAEPDIRFDLSFSNKELFKHIWSQEPGFTDENSRHAHTAKLLKSIILKNKEYHGADGKLRLTRRQVLSVAEQLYAHKDCLKNYLKHYDFSKECTKNRATTLVRLLLTSLGYSWPKHGYTGDKKMVRINLGGRAITYKQSFTRSASLQAKSHLEHSNQ